MMRVMTRAFGQKLTIIAIVLLVFGIVMFLIPFPDTTRIILGAIPLVAAFVLGTAGVIVSNNAKS
jgi:hypothetical protein